jgi:hypothetical protein
MVGQMTILPEHPNLQVSDVQWGRVFQLYIALILGDGWFANHAPQRLGLSPTLKPAVSSHTV